MTDKKLTDNEIVKALECCKGEDVPCADCPYTDFGQWRAYVAKDALDLVNRQGAEIEELKSVINGFRGYDERIKVEVYKECTEKLKSIFGEWIYDYRTDNLLKEMVGDNNADRC